MLVSSKVNKNNNYYYAKYTGTIVITLSVLISLLILSTIIILFKNNYNDFCYLLLSKLGKLEKELYFKEHFLSEKKYKLIQSISIIISLSFIFFNLILIKKINLVQEKIILMIKAVNAFTYKQIDFILKLDIIIRLPLVSILLIQFLFFVYCAFKFPISYDEAWTYLNFTSKSMLTSISYYPAPNNHILFSIFTNLTDLFPINDAKIKMRIINIFFSIISSFVFFKLLCKFYSPKISLYTLSLFVFSYPVALYSIQARGYEMVILFSLIAIYSIFSYINNTSKKQLTIYFFSIILGFYTIPSFLYFFISLQLFILFYCLINKRITLLKKIIVADIISCLFTLALYTPIILMNGLDAITDNHYVKSVSLLQVMNDMPEHIVKSTSWLLGMNEGGGLIISIIIFIFLGSLINREESLKFKSIKWLMLFLLLTPLLIMITQRVIPFERTWIYLSIPIFFGISNIIYLISIKTQKLNFNKNLTYYTILISTIILLILKFRSAYIDKHQMDYQAYTIFSNINEHEIKTIASNEILMTDILEYKLNSSNKRKRIKILKINTNNTIQADLLILNNDSISHITNIGDYIFMGKNDFIKLYIKKR